MAELRHPKRFEMSEVGLLELLDCFGDVAVARKRLLDRGAGSPQRWYSGRVERSEKSLITNNGCAVDKTGHHIVMLSSDSRLVLNPQSRQNRRVEARHGQELLIDCTLQPVRQQLIMLWRVAAFDPSDTSDDTVLREPVRTYIDLELLCSFLGIFEVVPRACEPGLVSRIPVFVPGDIEL